MSAVKPPRHSNAFAARLGVANPPPALPGGAALPSGWQSMRPVGNAFAYGQRVDGTQKGQGYLGPLTNSQGQLMTEYSIGVNINGQDMEIPTFVPTLSEREIHYLLNMQEGMPIPPMIEQKAIDHAIERQRQGLSPFADTPWNPMRRPR